MIDGRPTPVKNVGSDEIPPYGVMEIAGADISQSTQDRSRIELHVRQIGSEHVAAQYRLQGGTYVWQRSLAFNGASRIEENHRGVAQPVGHVYYAGVTIPAWDMEDADDNRNTIPCYAMRGKPYLEHLPWTTGLSHPNGITDPVTGIDDYLVSEWRILTVLREIPGQNAKLCLVQPIPFRIYDAVQSGSGGIASAYGYGGARLYLTESVSGAEPVARDSIIQIPVANMISGEDIAEGKRLHVALVDGKYEVINADC